MTRGKATFRILTWDEKPIDESVGDAKLVRASVRRSFTGAVEGSSVLEYLMAYRPDGTATFVGLERVTGIVEGREGSFVLRQEGTYENGVATAECTIVPNSGAGGLSGITGTSRFATGHAEDHEMTFEYELDSGA